LQLERIFTDNFRNLSRREIAFHPHLNIVLGQNAQGKTNLLEAVYLLALASSHRTSKDQEMITWDKEYFFVKGEIERKDQVFTVSVGCREGRKRIRFNESPLERVRDLLGRVMVIFFGPDDLRLVKGSPQERRLFLNREISLLYPLYYDYLQRFKSVLNQRNNLLKELAQKRGSEEILEPWDAQFAASAAWIIKRRIDFIEELTPLVKKHYFSISGEHNALELKYAPSLTMDLKSSEKDWETGILSALKRRREEEVRRGITLVGPHRDDLEFRLGGQEVKNFGSQGQQRTVVLALKIGQVEFINKKAGERPILLLDDVFSELDGYRQKALLDLISGDIQSIITTTDSNFKGLSIAGHIYSVSCGEINLKEGRS